MIEATVAAPRILVVEDDPEQSEQMERTLSDLGYHVVDRANSGLSGVEAARRHHPDLVLMDVRLPGALDGVGAARAICETDDIPMVFVTGASGGDELRRVISSTPHGYVVKPFGRGQLEAAVELGLHRWRSEHARKEREKWLELMLRSHEDIVVVLDDSGTVEYVSPSVEAVLGLPPTRHVGRDFLERSHPEDRSRVRQAMEAVIGGSAERLRMETRFRRVGGGWRRLRLEGEVYRPGSPGHAAGASGERVRLVVRARDMTRGRARERRRQASEERYRMLFRNGAAGAFQATLGGDLTDANDALVHMLGYGSREELLRASVGGLVPTSAAGVDHPEELRRGRSMFSAEVRLQKKDGAELIGLVGVSVTLRDGGEGPLVVGIVMDITRRKRMEADLERMAFEDPLTGLMNRRAFDDHAARYLALAKRRRTHLGIIYLDLIGFKSINDGLGHEAGDEVLAVVARRLEAGARGSDLVCRMGGDEFVVLLPDVDSWSAAMDVAHRLDGELREPITAAGSSVAVRAAMGVAIYPDNGSSVDALLRWADRSLYGAKGGRVGRASQGLEVRPLSEVRGEAGEARTPGWRA